MRISWMYAALLIISLTGFPLVAAITELTNIESTPYSILLRSVILLISLLLVGLAGLQHSVSIASGAFWVPFVVFWLAYLGRLAVESAFGSAHLSRAVEEYWAWAIGGCLVPAVALLTYPTRDYVAMAYRPLLAISTVAGGLVAWTGSGMLVSENWFLEERGRLLVAALNPISVGHLGASLLLLSIWPLILRRRQLMDRRTLALMIGGGVGIFLLVASASRGPLMALIVTVMFYFLSQNWRRAAQVVLIAVMLLGAMAWVATYLEELGSYKFLARIESALSGDDVAIGIRQSSYAGALQQFLNSPLIGDALEERETGFYPHNVLLEGLMATGLIGGLPLILLLGYSLQCCYRVFRRGYAQGRVCLLYLQFLIGAQFSGAIYSATNMWALLAVVLVVHQRFARADRGSEYGATDGAPTRASHPFGSGVGTTWRRT